MKRSRRKLAALLPAAVTATFKVKVAIEALKERQTLAELAEELGRYPRRIQVDSEPEFLA